MTYCFIIQNIFLFLNNRNVCFYVSTKKFIFVMILVLLFYIGISAVIEKGGMFLATTEFAAMLLE